MNFPVLEQGEAPKVLAAWLMVFFISMGSILGWASIQSMLLKRAGVDFLPYAYIGMGVLGMLGSSGYLMFAGAVRRDKLLIGSATCLAVALLAARMLVPSRPMGQAGSPWKLILFFCITFGVLILTTSIITGQLRTITDDVFRMNRGRKPSPLLHGSGTVGGICGGISVHLLTFATDTPNLVIAWALSLLAVVPLLLLLRKRYDGEPCGIPRDLPGKPPKPGVVGNLAEGMRFIRGSALLRLLSLLATAFWVVAGLTDFQFSRIMDATFPSEQSLSRFFGDYAIGLNSAILIIQAALTGRIIQRAGAGRCLSLPSLVGLAGFGLLAQSFSFLSGLFMRSSWEAAGRTIRSSSFQLVLNAATGTLRGRVQDFLDEVVAPAGGILSGLLVLFMIRAVPQGRTMTGLDLVTTTGLLFCAASFFIALAAHRQYIAAVTANLDSHDRQTLLDSLGLMGKGTGPVVLQKLMDLARSENKQVSMAALAALARLEKLPALKVISEMMNSEDEDLRVSAVRAARRFDDIRRHPLLRSHLKGRMQKSLMEDPSGPVRTEAARFLARFLSREEMFRMVNGMLQHPVPAGRCKVVEQLSELQGDFAASYLEDMIEDAAPAVRAAAVAVLWHIPGKKAGARRIMEGLFTAESGEAHATALQAVIRLGTVEWLPKIEPFLDDPTPGVQTLAALACLAVGKESSPAWDRAVVKLTASLSDPSRAEEIRCDVLPLLSYMKPGGLDAVGRGVAALPPEAQEYASGVLEDFRAVLNRQTANTR